MIVIGSPHACTTAGDFRANCGDARGGGLVFQPATAPPIAHFQSAGEFDPAAGITVAPGGGRVLLIEKAR